MLIYLTKSKLFTVDPANRFAQEYKLKEDVWREIWKRYKLLAYTVPELCEYMQIKTKGKVKFTNRTMHRWIMRAEIYNRSAPAIKRGVEVVSTAFFEHFEQDVIDEITRHMKAGVTEDSRLVV